MRYNLQLLYQLLHTYARGTYVRRALSGSVAVQLVGMVVAFGSNWVLAQLCTNAQYGMLVYALSVVGLLGGVAAAAYDDMCVKWVAAYRTQQQYALLRGLLHTAVAVTSLLAMVLAVLWYFAPAYLSGMYQQVQYQHALRQTMALLLPVWALTQCSMAVLRGAGSVVRSQVPEGVVRPVLFLVVGIISTYYLPLPPTAADLLRCYAWVSVVVLCWSVVQAYQVVSGYIGLVKAQYEWAGWAKASGAFLLLSGINLINLRTDLLAVGGWLPPEYTAYYNLGAKLSELPKMAFLVSNMVFAPLIAQYFAQQQQQQLQRLASRSARLSLLIGLPMVLALGIGGKWVMSLWGEAFVQAYPVLLVLCVGQLFNLACGLSGSLLAMTGNERWLLVALLLSLSVNLSLNAWLIPQWGMMGAAVAVTVSTIVKNICWVIAVRKTLHIRAMAL